MDFGLAPQLLCYCTDARTLWLCKSWNNYKPPTIIRQATAPASDMFLGRVVAGSFYGHGCP